jgi:hypothetical protein
MNRYGPSTLRAFALVTAAFLVVASLFLFGAPAPRVLAAPATSPSVAEAQALVKKNPKDPNAYFALGTAYRRAGKEPGRPQAFQKMAALVPKAGAHVSLGAVVRT